jgi:hypothetical protein
MYPFVEVCRIELVSVPDQLACFIVDPSYYVTSVRVVKCNGIFDYLSKFGVVIAAWRRSTLLTGVREVSS